MKPSILLLGIAGFGALGAVTRFLLSAWINRLLPTTLPWGTLVVNVLGCLLIGFLVEWDLRSEYFPSHWRVMVGAGFLGALTTFSTFGHETIWLLQRGEFRWAVASVGLNLLVGLGAILLGADLARRLCP